MPEGVSDLLERPAIIFGGRDVFLYPNDQMVLQTSGQSAGGRWGLYRITVTG